MGLLGISCRAIFERGRAVKARYGKNIRPMGTLLGLGLIFGTTFLPAKAQSNRVDSPVVGGERFQNVYQWHDDNQAPRAIVVAVHGLTMHGTVFNSLAQHLAQEGILVYAPDLRGYGAWQKAGKDLSEDKKSSTSPTKDNHSKVAYQASCDDLLSLISAAKKENPDLPLFCIGESLGADLAMEAAGDMPDAINGLIVSSPAIKRKSHMARMAIAVGKIMTNPHMILDVTPYIKLFASEDARVANEALSDPLIRRKLSAQDLLRTFKLIDESLKYADRVPTKTPVLVLQGDRDAIIDSSDILKLAQHLGSSDQTIKWMKGKGHLLLETSFISDNAFHAVDEWLDRQTGRPQEQLPLAVSLHKSLAFPLAVQLASD